ncbi:T9SS type A sorting domain-containing protein [Lentimicrobium sp. L6]|uniref:T9SS type A sorting domain-containing protein n=1 Tax=Lentimicrobium sp. L6 TaxID=2735916 RepID=UPI0015572F42|nr:T9SS type A sorting domain-containing protein [Lentimicrobium sp. L6]NPD83986.1 T9SS type A sorting domain-containing protein [Lentimicrobium sp. L6]
MKKVAFIISLVFISIIGHSQSCLPNGITFTTQEQIDNFPTDYPNCNQIEGPITIGNYPDGTTITNLDGLNNITQIDGGLNIYFNLNLSSLSGLSNLTHIGGNVSIFYNPELFSLEGLNNLNVVEGDLKLGEYELTVGNDNFQDLSGLNGLTQVEGNLILFKNQNVSTLTGLENLISIGQNLEIHNHQNLVNLNGLQNLSSISGTIIINSNNILNDISGIKNINVDSINNLTIFDNQQLSNCHVKSICDYIAIPDASFDILNNNTGCDNSEQVEENCETIGIIEHNNLISIQPNPAKDFVQFHFEQENEIIIRIYNTKGEFIEELEGNTELIWNCKSFSSGLYFYTANSKHQSYSGKVIIQ